MSDFPNRDVQQQSSTFPNRELQQQSSSDLSRRRPRSCDEIRDDLATSSIYCEETTTTRSTRRDVCDPCAPTQQRSSKKSKNKCDVKSKKICKTVECGCWVEERPLQTTESCRIVMEPTMREVEVRQPMERVTHITESILGECLDDDKKRKRR
ncbi:hypothetical protein RCL1_000741 [Eukaryota sp. TZLM3-RCL]